MRGGAQRELIPRGDIHLCHAMGCAREVPPALLMCLRHWRLVPREIQRLVWKHYRKGQEIDKRPSKEYLEVMKLAIRSVAEQEGLLEVSHVG